MPILSCHWKKLGQKTNETFKNQMLRLPCPGLLSGHRANFDACADKISTFLLFQKEVMGYRMMATQIRPTTCPPPPHQWILPSNMVAVTSHAPSAYTLTFYF
jgi:hypothetical protein